MKKLIAGIGAALISSAMPVAAADNDGWVTAGLDRATGVPAAWIKLRNAEQVNDDSFKVMFRDGNGERLITVNCKNKDFFLQGYKGWHQLAPDTGFHQIGEMVCRHFPVRTKWGYTSEFTHLWNAQEPPGDPGDASGDWTEQAQTEAVTAFVNDEAFSDGKVVMYSQFVETRQQDAGTGTKRNTQEYSWMITDCKKNRFSMWVPYDDKNLRGSWTPPKPGRPDGTARYARKKFCSKPNATFATLPLPTVESMRRYAD